jgi:hypothetical protein
MTCSDLKRSCRRHKKRRGVNGEYDFAANSNLKESFLNSNEDMKNIGGIRGTDVLGYK